jgi:hypothetical protein
MRTLNLSPDPPRIVKYLKDHFPTRRPTTAELLEVPWFAEDLPFYTKAFGIGRRIHVAQLSGGDMKSIPQFLPD